MDEYIQLMQDVDQLTQLIRAFYEGYVRQGFTEWQAILLCRTHIQSMFPHPTQ